MLQCSHEVVSREMFSHAEETEVDSGGDDGDYGVGGMASSVDDGAGRRVRRCSSRDGVMRCWTLASDVGSSESRSSRAECALWNCPDLSPEFVEEEGDCTNCKSAQGGKFHRHHQHVRSSTNSIPNLKGYPWENNTDGFDDSDAYQKRKSEQIPGDSSCQGEEGPEEGINKVMEEDCFEGGFSLEGKRETVEFVRREQ